MARSRARLLEYSSPSSRTFGPCCEPQLAPAVAKAPIDDMWLFISLEKRWAKPECAGSEPRPWLVR